MGGKVGGMRGHQRTKPTNSSTNSEAEAAKKGTPASPAAAFARRVFPVDAGGRGIEITMRAEIVAQRCRFDGRPEGKSVCARACPRRPDEQHSSGHPRAERSESRRVLESLDDLLELLLAEASRWVPNIAQRVFCGRGRQAQREALGLAGGRALASSQPATSSNLTSIVSPPAL